MGQPKYVIINDTSEPRPNATNAPFIFISYSHKDNDLVYPIVHTLIENQVPEFYPAPYTLHSLTALTVQYPPFFEIFCATRL